MKKYLKVSGAFAIAGVFGGIFYREFSKALGMANQFSVLGLTHVHFLVLGMLAVLVFGLVSDRIKLDPKREKQTLLVYAIGAAGTGVMLFTHGVIDMLIQSRGITVASWVIPAISGVAGLFHIVLGSGLALFFCDWLKACKD